ncbi:protein FANTASTIC FOUR 3-like [Salvia divinorum]|uniref:Protein FANTASTIC FOUR 3-like n=1 Tax=Salvia divinorum TaxID=28513 RepID=A0ABD1GZX3_SALDI
MSTIVCQQNYVSCFDPQLTTLKLRVSPPSAGDHSLQSSSLNKDFYYTHPLSKLTPISLQLCTENLGSESGYDTFSDCTSIFSASPPLSPTCKQNKPSPKYCRKINNFPPPLTTMSGASSLQVRRRRDGGRLIIDAVEGPFRNSYLHAERSDGRLKLCFTTAAAGEEFRNESESDVEMNLSEKFQRFSRCKDGGSHESKGLCSNWKPSTLWVATS